MKHMSKLELAEWCSEENTRDLDDAAAVMFAMARALREMLDGWCPECRPSSGSLLVGLSCFLSETAAEIGVPPGYVLRSVASGVLGTIKDGKADSRERRRERASEADIRDTMVSLCLKAESYSDADNADPLVTDEGELTADGLTFVVNAASVLQEVAREKLAQQLNPTVELTPPGLSGPEPGVPRARGRAERRADRAPR